MPKIGNACSFPALLPKSCRAALQPGTGPKKCTAKREPCPKKPCGNDARDVCPNHRLLQCNNVTLTTYTIAAREFFPIYVPGRWPFAGVSNGSRPLTIIRSGSANERAPATPRPQISNCSANCVSCSSGVRDADSSPDNRHQPPQQPRLHQGFQALSTCHCASGPGHDDGRHDRCTRDGHCGAGHGLYPRMRPGRQPRRTGWQPTPPLRSYCSFCTSCISSPTFTLISENSCGLVLR